MYRIEIIWLVHHHISTINSILNLISFFLTNGKSHVRGEPSKWRQNLTNSEPWCLIPILLLVNNMSTGSHWTFLFWLHIFKIKWSDLDSIQISFLVLSFNSLCYHWSFSIMWYSLIISIVFFLRHNEIQSWRAWFTMIFTISS